MAATATARTRCAPSPLTPPPVRCVLLQPDLRSRHVADVLPCSCPAALQGGGFLALETDGWGQGEVVAALLEAMRAPGSSSPAFERVAVVPDYAGVRRFVTAWRTQ